MSSFILARGDFFKGCFAGIHFNMINLRLRTSLPLENSIGYQQGMPAMESYEQHVPILEFLFRKTGLNAPELSEIPEILEDQIQQATYSDLQHSKMLLYEYIAKLEAQNKELRAYASTVAHDLKEPLAVMVITSDQITNIPDLTLEALKLYLGQIRSAVHQMDTIINALLLFAKVSQTEAPVEHMDMSLVVANVQNRLSHMLQEHQAQLDLPEFWPDAIGYAPWIEEVWANYLSNALKYGGRPPHVKLGASIQPNGMIQYWMRDNGLGLSLDAQAQLFTQFTQIGNISGLGHGLGLSIVLRIVEKLGGQVGIESEVGKGSLFFFTLPAASASSLAKPALLPSN
ncbi:MAG: HAMP domain-containing sensor histidine kinase [Chloroflexota bacterium]